MISSPSAALLGIFCYCQILFFLDMNVWQLLISTDSLLRSTLFHILLEMGLVLWRVTSLFSSLHLVLFHRNQSQVTTLEFLFFKMYKYVLRKHSCRACSVGKE